MTVGIDEKNLGEAMLNKKELKLNRTRNSFYLRQKTP